MTTMAMQQTAQKNTGSGAQANASTQTHSHTKSHFDGLTIDAHPKWEPVADIFQHGSDSCKLFLDKASGAFAVSFQHGKGSSAAEAIFQVKEFAVDYPIKSEDDLRNAIDFGKTEVLAGVRGKLQEMIHDKNFKPFSSKLFGRPQLSNDVEMRAVFKNMQLYYLSNTIIKDQKWGQISLKGARLANVLFTGKEMDLSGADLTNVIGHNVDIAGGRTQRDRVDAQGIILTGAQFSGGSSFIGVNFRDMACDKTTRFNDSPITHCNLIGMKGSFSHNDLDRAVAKAKRDPRSLREDPKILAEVRRKFMGSEFDSGFTPEQAEILGLVSKPLDEKDRRKVMADPTNAKLIYSLEATKGIDTELQNGMTWEKLRDIISKPNGDSPHGFKDDELWMKLRRDSDGAVLLVKTIKGQRACEIFDGNDKTTHSNTEAISAIRDWAMGEDAPSVSSFTPPGGTESAPSNKSNGPSTTVTVHPAPPKSSNPAKSTAESVVDLTETFPGSGIYAKPNTTKSGSTTDKSGSNTEARPGEVEIAPGVFAENDRSPDLFGARMTTTEPQAREGHVLVNGIWSEVQGTPVQAVHNRKRNPHDVSVWSEMEGDFTPDSK
jgi:hypothetical protein